MLTSALGKHKFDAWEEVKLAIRNVARPSEVLRLSYAVSPVSEPGPPLTIVVEANVTERTAHREIVELPFEVPFRDASLHTQVRSFDIHEMLGTKLRALFQRRRGRDLFDLFWALRGSAHPAVQPALVIESFQYYMRAEGSRASRRELLRVFDEHLADAGFCSDMEPLLRTGLVYDVQAAGALVREQLLALLPP